MSTDMRFSALYVFAAATLFCGSAFAQTGGWASTPEGRARWFACYKETRLIHRTKNKSSQDYRRIIKEARREHMRDCMTRAEPPAPMPVVVRPGKDPETAVSSWASNN
ncbi:hypothetical protein [Microvirga splendida]|uniref:Uncharacterized protein n=1 Tax=Microvirga splendida TaxID=2795727 RepID=A0ABS0XZ90_9HYPH|nr:hypothetical protein [Microvirga splendida]MBJ6125380.1 hypothetical protein [Microvirga splendida]